MIPLQGSDAFSQSGLYSNHQDIGPRYSVSVTFNLIRYIVLNLGHIIMFLLQGVLLGLSNTAGVLAGVFGTAATGYILQKGKSFHRTLSFTK